MALAPKTHVYVKMAEQEQLSYITGVLTLTEVTPMNQGWAYIMFDKL